MPEDEDQPDRPEDFDEIGDFRDAAEGMHHAALIIPKGEDVFFVNAIDPDGHTTKVYKFSIEEWDRLTAILDDRDVDYDIYEG